MDSLLLAVVFLLPKESHKAMGIHHCDKCTQVPFSQLIQEVQRKSNHYW